MMYKTSFVTLLIVLTLSVACAKPQRIVPVTDQLTVSCELGPEWIGIGPNLWQDIELVYSFCAEEDLLPPGEAQWFPAWYPFDCPEVPEGTVKMLRQDFLRLTENLQMCQHYLELRKSAREGKHECKRKGFGPCSAGPISSE